MVTKKTTDFSALDFNTGETLLIDKPARWTSFDVVNKIKRVLNVKKVGHSGTLDPMATGLLILLTGKSTKQMTGFQDLDKTYTGIITLGKSSPSMDTETELIAGENPVNISEAEILEARNSFLGEIIQLPPMYSALKVNGKRLYKLARKGKTIERKPRTVQIHKFEIKKMDIPDIHFEIKCSKGTYIRVIANDFGEKLGCGAVLSNLRRTEIGNFSVNDAFTVQEFINEVSAVQQPGFPGNPG